MAQNYQAAVVHSQGCAVDYTPSGAESVGDVVVQGQLVGVATRDIAANALGALYLEGVFNVVKANGAIDVGDALYWDADGNPQGGTAGTGCATTTAATNTFIGRAVAAAGATDEYVTTKLMSNDAADA